MSNSLSGPCAHAPAATFFHRSRIPLALLVLLLAAGFGFVASAHAAVVAPAAAQASGEARLILPNLNQGTFLGTSGRVVLLWGLVVCALGLLFGFVTYTRLRDLPVHRSMREVSELIWETCKTYLFTQGKFLIALEALIAVIIVIYFGYFDQMSALKVATIFAFSVLGILGSYAVAWYGIRVNTFANSRTAFASLEG